MVGHSLEDAGPHARRRAGGPGSALGPGTALVFASALTPDRGQSPATLMTNMAMAANLAALPRGTSPSGCCVYVGSDAVYGFGEKPVTEDTPVTPPATTRWASTPAERVMECAARAGGSRCSDAAGDRRLRARRSARVLRPQRLRPLPGPGPHGPDLRRGRGGARPHLRGRRRRAWWRTLLRRGATGVFNVATGRAGRSRTWSKTIRGLVPYEVTVTSAARGRGRSRTAGSTPRRLRRALPGLRFTPFREGLRATLAAFGAIANA